MSINDEVIWQVINQQFCSFKSKIASEQTFCRNPYNVTGLCLRSACPLANSRYATIREHSGVCYLYMKTVERAHLPNQLWEKIRLPKNYRKALEMVAKHLEFFPKYLQHRNKQRLTKIHQYLIRMRKLSLKKNKPKLVGIDKKQEKRERVKEMKALKAAKVEHAIEKELLNRLKEGAYGDIYNFPELEYENALDTAQGEFEDKEGVRRQEQDDEEMEEFEKEMEMEEEGEEFEEADYDDENDEDDSDFDDEFDDEDVGKISYVDGKDEGLDDESDEDMEDFEGYDFNSEDDDDDDNEDSAHDEDENYTTTSESDDDRSSSDRKKDDTKSKTRKHNQQNENFDEEILRSIEAKQKKNQKRRKDKKSKYSPHPLLELEYEQEMEDSVKASMERVGGSSTSW